MAKLRNWYSQRIIYRHRSDSNSLLYGLAGNALGTELPQVTVWSVWYVKFEDVWHCLTRGFLLGQVCRGTDILLRCFCAADAKVWPDLLPARSCISGIEDFIRIGWVECLARNYLSGLVTVSRGSMKTVTRKHVKLMGIEEKMCASGWTMYDSGRLRRVGHVPCSLSKPWRAKHSTLWSSNSAQCLEQRGESVSCSGFSHCLGPPLSIWAAWDPVKMTDVSPRSERVFRWAWLVSSARDCKQHGWLPSIEVTNWRLSSFGNSNLLEKRFRHSGPRLSLKYSINKAHLNRWSLNIIWTSSAVCPSKSAGTCQEW